MQPDEGTLVPGHALVHAQNQIAVGIEAGVALGFSPGITHVAKALADEIRADEGYALQFEGFTGICVNAVSSLFGFFTGECCRHKAWMAYQSVDGAGFLGVGVAYLIHGHTIGTSREACNAL